MKILSDLAELAALRKHEYLAIGVFDGVHLGHQTLLRAAREDAEGARGLAVAMTFNPLPAQVLRPDHAPPLLTSLNHKLALIAAHGMEATLVKKFDLKFASIPPRAFLEQLYFSLGSGALREICVGHNFRFGHNRAGDSELIVKMGGELGFAVKVIQPIKVGNEIISSTVIRRAVAKGELERAAAMLGRWHSIWGKVARGAGRGEKLGFPTANVDTKELLPPNGVYAVRVKMIESSQAGRPVPPIVFHGVANLGTRPTFEKHSVPLLEIHLFDFAKKIYGTEIEVEFVQKLREEKTFAGAQELKMQIEKDAMTARAILRVTRG